MKRLGMDIEKAQEDGNLFIIGGPIASLNSYMHKVDASIDNIIKEIEDVVRQNQIKRQMPKLLETLKKIYGLNP